MIESTARAFSDITMAFALEEHRRHAVALVSRQMYSWKMQQSRQIKPSLRLQLFRGRAALSGTRLIATHGCFENGL